jgi:hypothetical protein
MEHSTLDVNVVKKYYPDLPHQYNPNPTGYAGVVMVKQIKSGEIPFPKNIPDSVDLIDPYFASVYGSKKSSKQNQGYRSIYEATRSK